MISQFENIEVTKTIWPMVRNRQQVDKLLENIKDLPGIVLYTMVDSELIAYMQAECTKLHTVCIAAIANVVEAFSNYMHMKGTRHIPGGQHTIFNDSYFKKIDALNFTINHDDGQMIESANEADIIIIGVSRTSKSPTSLYLGYRGYKIANIPFINGINFPLDIKVVVKPLVVALHVLPEYLQKVRISRLSTLGNISSTQNNYTDLTIIKEEVVEAKKFYASNKLPVIDVTGKAIEETAAEILNLYFEKIGGHLTIN